MTANRKRLISCAVALVAATIAHAAGLTGRASVIDGDTLEIDGTRVRLSGTDAPESSHLCREDDRCGQLAANELADFIAGRPVACIAIDHDRYGRTVARCHVDGVDLADWLVRNGRPHHLPP
jgi:endonuclease YncB( thermonuclease family)